MNSIIHILASCLIFFSLSFAIPTTRLDFALILLANLIDIDHLNKMPIFDKKRNSFKTHFFHKNWKIISIISVVFLLFRTTLFFGLGILTHYILDYFDPNVKKK
jgi:hypothetical protein